MLKVRVIPTLLWKGVGLVKGRAFDGARRVGSVLPAIRVYNQRDVDELFLFDVSASIECRHPDFESVQRFAKDCFVPFAVGGGISCIDHVRQMLVCGADKVSINSAALERPGLIDEAAREFGAQCVVASIDVRLIDGKRVCVSHSGTVKTWREPVDWAKELEARGAGEILVTSVERDGCFCGYDIGLVRALSQAVTIPVIASGGAGCAEHMVEAVLEGGAAAVAAASIFHFTEQTPSSVKTVMWENGIPVRRKRTFEQAQT